METALPLVEQGTRAFVVWEVSEQFLPAIGAVGARVCEHIPLTPNSAFLTKSSSKAFHDPNALTQTLRMSTGSGNIMVVFFSTPISVSVCR